MVRSSGRFPVLATLCGLVMACFAGMVDVAAGPEVSSLLFYLIPVAFAAWWGDLACAILVALTAVLVRNQAHDLSATVRLSLCNSLIHFSFFAASSLISRFRQSLLREQALANTDGLTGAANARTFYHRAAQELQRCSRNKQPLTLAYLDVDNFKAINDRLGHPEGDELLRRVAATARREMRASDVIARLGGDEFALLLPDAGEEAGGDARPPARQLESGDGTPELGRYFQHRCRDLLAPSSATWTALVSYVDTLMYRAKRAGKARLAYEVVKVLRDTRHTPSARPERRAGVRLVCQQTAKVRLSHMVPGEEMPATILDISIQGVGLYLDQRLPVESLLTVEPLGLGADRTLLARVVRTIQGTRRAGPRLRASPADGRSRISGLVARRSGRGRSVQSSLSRPWRDRVSDAPDIPGPLGCIGQSDMDLNGGCRADSDRGRQPVLSAIP